MTQLGHHNGALVALSILIATMASYTALDLAGRIRATGGWIKYAWLATAAVAMGTGIWAMHFIAMLAMHMPGIDMGYDIGLTVLSFILPILVVGCSFYLVDRAESGSKVVLVIGLFMGFGIAAMHYTGMAALQKSAVLTYDPSWVVISVLIAVAASTVAMELTLRNTRLQQRLLAAPFMGLAIAGMHFSAMQGTSVTLRPAMNGAHEHAIIGQSHLALAIAATTFLILILTLAAAMVDRRFAYLAHREAAMLREREERYRALLEASAVVVWFATPDGMITESQGWTELCGQADSEYAATGWLSVVHSDDRANVMALWQRALETQSYYEGEFRVLHNTGEFRWVHSSAVPRRGGDESIIEWVGSIADIHNRKQAEEEVWWVAHHDTLTHLPNRMQFQCQLNEILDEARQNHSSVGLLLIDLDHFKDINDALGHDAGDALLQEIAARIKEVLSGSGVAARFGGDEFAVILTDLGGMESPATLARALIETFNKPFEHRGLTFSAKASIGVATSDHASDPRDLLKNADIALYQAKVRGRNQATLYSPEMRTVVERRIALFHEMRDASSNHLIVPFYQPKMCLSTGKVTGYEALMRWRHPTKGVLTPEYFSPIFDDLDLAAVLGRQVLEQVVSDLRDWRDRGLDVGRMAINLSPAEFMLPRLADDLLELLDSSGILAELFEIEVTETVLLGRGTYDASVTLERLHRSGIHVALDDFGTGYASLTHLKQFPVDHVKIDRSFINNLEQDTDDEAIVTAVIGLVDSLNLQVTAEGVETDGQVQRLRDLGCHHAQGYFFARPMPAADVPGFLACRLPTGLRDGRKHAS